jgi:hypothetical protein
MDPFTPFAGLMVGCLIAAAIQQGWSRLPNRQLWDGFSPEGSPQLAAVWSIGLVALLGLSTYKDQTKSPPPNAFVLGARLAHVANSTYDRNLPMLDRHIAKAKNLTALYDVYMSDKLLAKAGKLPSFDEAKIVEPRLKSTYLVKDPSVYNTRVLHELMGAGCVIEVTRNRQGYVLTPSSGLPAECDGVLAKAIQ